ncbi:MAG: alpha/beta hydrolase [Gemmatimonadota bacterium]
MKQTSASVSRDVHWTLEGATVDATVVRPAGAGPFPGVVFVAGSGPTDRNWNSPLLPGTNGSAALLAEACAAAGIVSLRYDKRASGPRARETIMAMAGRVSMRGHADELAGAVRALASEPNVRRDRLYAIANSEGTLHALNYQLQEPEIPLAGLALIAPPGRSVGVVARAQLAAQAALVPDGEAMMARYDAAVARFVAGEEVPPDPALPPGVQGLLQSLTAPVNLPFTRELWTTDGASLLRQVHVPVLVVIGKKDIQVDWRDDGRPLKQAVAGRDGVSFAFPSNANHVLKHEPRPRGELTAEAAVSYNAEGAILDPEATEIVLAWLWRLSSP